MTELRPRHLSLFLFLPFAALTVMFVGLELTPAPAHAENEAANTVSASDAIRTKQEKVVTRIQAGASDAELQAELDDLLDYEWLATYALGGPKHYAKVCGERGDEFRELLTRLIRATYLQLIREAEKHPIDYLGEVAGRNDIYKVTTRVEVEKNGREQALTIEYVMHQTEGGWRVRDILTDDVSLARTYRYEFNKIAQKEGIAGIITKLEDKLAESENP